MTRPGLFALMLFTLALSACGTTRQAARDPLTPLPGAVVDPDNEVFMAAVGEYIRARGGPADSRFQFTRIDLDNDGRREGIVFLTAPYASWCNDNGCRMVVFKAHDDGFTLVSEISTVRGPLTVSQNRTHGWRDLIANISGRFDVDKHDVALQYNGQSYPLQPDQAPAVQMAANDATGVKIFP